MAADRPPGFPDVVLLVRLPCEACQGDGDVMSEDWRGFDDWAARRGLTSEQRAERVEDYFLGACDYASVPPVRQVCEHCSGAGRVDDELSVDVLIDRVLAHVPLSVIAHDELESTVATLKASLASAAMKSQGLADPDEAGSWLRTVQEAAEALRAVTGLLVSRSAL